MEVLLATEAQCPAVEPALSLSAQIFFVVTLSLTAVSFFVVGAMSGWCAARLVSAGEREQHQHRHQLQVHRSSGPDHL